MKIQTWEQFYNEITGNQTMVGNEGFLQEVYEGYVELCQKDKEYDNLQDKIDEFIKGIDVMMFSYICREDLYKDFMKTLTEVEVEHFKRLHQEDHLEFSIEEYFFLIVNEKLEIF